MTDFDQKRLKNALELLPERDAPSAIWSFLDKKLAENALLEALQNLPERDGPAFFDLFSEEKLAEIELQKALENLPERDGPPFVELFSSEKLAEIELQKALEKLPERDGPPTVWQNLEAELLRKSTSENGGKGRIIALPRATWRLAAAASAVGLAAFLFLKSEDKPIEKPLARAAETAPVFEKKESSATTEKAENAIVLTKKASKTRILETKTISKTDAETVTLSFAEEQIDSDFTAQNEQPTDRLESEKTAIALVETFCAEQIAACETSDFKTLKSQLDDLSAACERLQTALENFGFDADLQCQLGLLERQRSEVLKKLVEFAIG